MARITIYLAGPLFGIADRHHNLLIAKELRSLGYQVILPQVEVLKFLNGRSFDLKGVSENCARQAAESDVVVANLDGADADSGTALEVGIVVRKKQEGFNTKKSKPSHSKPLIVCVRTDFRTAMEQEIGVNAMFRLVDRIIYKPSFANSLEEVKEFYKELAKQIDNAIRQSM